MRYTAILLLFVPFIFTGSGKSSYNCNCDQIDTIKMRKIIQAKLDSMSTIKVQELDSIKEEMRYEAKQLRRRSWIGHTDKDIRPNGHIYLWKWWYKTKKTKYSKDTLFHRVVVERIK